MPITFSFADEGNVPIPPVRPDIMNVPRSYIDQLMANEGLPNLNLNKKPEQRYIELLNEIDPSAPPHNGDFIFDDKDDEYDDEIESLNEQEAFFSIENHNFKDSDNVKTSSITNDKIIDDIIPIPIHKPTILASAQKTASLETSGKKALISFTLNPDQIDLNDNLKRFLIDHAISMFKNDQNLRMEIYSYATLDDKSEYSDIKKSLARAMEVRRFLLGHNIKASRLKIIPIGLDQENRTSNRIDLLFIVSK